MKKTTLQIINKLLKQKALVAPAPNSYIEIHSKPGDNTLVTLQF